MIIEHHSLVYISRLSARLTKPHWSTVTRMERMIAFENYLGTKLEWLSCAYKGIAEDMWVVGVTAVAWQALSNLPTIVLLVIHYFILTFSDRL